MQKGTFGRGTLGAMHAALEPFREVLAADGYEMSLQLDESELTISVRAGSAACSDCVVPESVMRMVIDQALTDAGLATTPYRLVMPGR